MVSWRTLKSGRSLRKPWIPVGIILLPIGVILTVSYLVSVSDVTNGPLFLATFVICLMALHLMTKIAFHEGFDLLEAINWVFLYAVLGYVVVPFYIILTGRYSYLIRAFTAEERLHSMATALIYVSLGLVSFYLGYKTQLSRKIGSRIPVFSNKWSPRRVKHVLLIFTIIGGVCFATYAHYGGGLSYLFTHMQERWYINLQIPGANYLMWGIRLLIISVYIWFVHYLTSKKHKVFWLYMLATSGLMFAFGGRGRVMGIWLVMLIIYHYWRKGIDLRKLITVGIVMLIFLLFFTIWVETTGQRGAPPLAGVSYLLQGEYFGGLTPFMFIIQHVPNGLNIQLGRTFLNILVFPIPRAVWPEKPVAAGRLILLPFFPEQGGGVGVPLVAELYLNFLLPGILAGMFLFGFVARIFYAYMKTNIDNKGVLLIYSSILLPWILGLLVADFVTTTIPCLETLIPLIIALLYVTRGKILKRTWKEGRSQESPHHAF